MSIQEIATEAGLSMVEAWRKLDGWMCNYAATDPLPPQDESMVRAILTDAGRIH